MILSNIKKNKIELTDYNYVRDIENRLLLAGLSANEVEILEEIINGSLKFTVSGLAKSLGIKNEAIKPVLEKFSATNLLKQSGDTVVVDKELRKYYEVHMLKFQSDFEPGMEFLQSLLSKIPIHLLPNWYSISRTSDHIFNSIVEKYLATPKIYERYLDELTFDEPELEAIAKEVFKAPDFKVSSSALMDQFGLTHEQFEKFLLILEFNLVCCISYEYVENTWEEVVTPFYEWRQYLRFMRDTAPKSVVDAFAIERTHLHDFGFAKDLSALLRLIDSTPLSIDQIDELKSQCLSDLTSAQLTPSYTKQLVKRLVQLQLVTESPTHIETSKYAAEWLKLPIQDQAFSIYRLHPQEESVLAQFSERDVREVEKALRRVVYSGWISFESFFAGMSGQVGDVEAVNLTCKGKKWKYSLPVYSTAERQFVESTLKEKLFESGMVAIGIFEGALYFSVTPFGRMSLGE